MKRVTLILGGARSGKSRYAEALARRHKGVPAYIATAEITDEEMRERIHHHREQRGAHWRTIEAPVDLVTALRQADNARSFTLIECLTVWINNLIYHGRDVAREVERFRQSLAKTKGQVVIVSNEVGLGIVPDNALARRFRDEAGRANQAIADAADEVVFIAAGLPMTLKKPKPAAQRSRPKGKARRRRG
ncbi:bifunctional adenosylcobinamide kinase/adenosylcobinamide-phosphate guanylyltransferase [Taklimakanibacter deserti]|uniref:bifunctional adenosylcobinamide kinase/adenosylcobinamide-phosphate guanylyltransferase n=1 Tax=Taklimakanibacter deserti TaxID=2267839 RepID=UPI000E64DCE9